MARIFDIVEYPNEMQNEFVHRIPEVGSGDFRIGSQLIVREAQSAVCAGCSQGSFHRVKYWNLALQHPIPALPGRHASHHLGSVVHHL